jgi:hypothetical protein
MRDMELGKKTNNETSTKEKELKKDKNARQALASHIPRRQD